MAPWGEEAGNLPSGLPDNYVFTVREAYAGFPFEENPDSCNVILKGEQNEDGDLSDGDIRLGVGDFEPGDKEGTFLIHATSQDPKKRVSRNSKYGKFFKSAIDAGMLDALGERAEAAGQGDLYEKGLKMWVGAVLRIKVVEETGVFKKGESKGQSWTSRTPLIEEFLGFEGEGAPASAPAAKASTNGSGEFNAIAASEQAANFLEYVEKGTAAGLDPNDERLTRPYFDKLRSS